MNHVPPGHVLAPAVTLQTLDQGGNQEAWMWRHCVRATEWRGVVLADGTITMRRRGEPLHMSMVHEVLAALENAADPAIRFPRQAITCRVGWNEKRCGYWISNHDASGSWSRWTLRPTVHACDRSTQPGIRRVSWEPTVPSKRWLYDHHLVGGDCLGCCRGVGYCRSQAHHWRASCGDTVNPVRGHQGGASPRARGGPAGSGASR